MIKLIEDWRNAWKFASVQWSTVGFLLMAGIDLVNQTLMQLPPAVQDKIPHAPTIAMVFFGLGIVGRVFKFTEKETDGDQQP